MQPTTPLLPTRSPTPETATTPAAEGISNPASPSTRVRLYGSMDAPLTAILCLFAISAYLFYLWRQAAKERPLHDAKNEAAILALKTELCRKTEDRFLVLQSESLLQSARIARMEGDRDRRDAEIRQKLADFEQVLRTRLRFEP